VALVVKNVHKWTIINFIHGEKQDTKNTMSQHTKQKTNKTKHEEKHNKDKLINIRKLIRT